MVWCGPGFPDTFLLCKLHSKIFSKSGIKCQVYQVPLLLNRWGLPPIQKLPLLSQVHFFFISAFFFFYQHSFLDPTKYIVPCDCIVSQYSELFVFLKIHF